MPTCRLCGHAFTRWTSLRAHINAGQCPRLALSLTSPASFSTQFNGTGYEEQCGLAHAELSVPSPQLSAFRLPCQATADVAPMATDHMSSSPALPGLALPETTPVPLASDAEVLGAASVQESVPIVCDPIFCARLRKEGWQQLLHDENVRSRSMGCHALGAESASPVAC